MLTKIGIFFIIGFYVGQVFAGIENLSTYRRFDSTTILQLKKVLNHRTNALFEEEDFVSYHNKRQNFDNKKTVQFNQKDIVIDTFINLNDRLFKRFFLDNGDIQLQIIINRSASNIIKSIIKEETVNSAVRAAAQISEFGTTRVPAIISDDFVDDVAPLSSAYSQLQAERGMVYEAFRVDKYNDLIIAHEGFHSAMRLLTSINRMNKLSKYIPMPLASGDPYDPYLQNEIELLEKKSAPHLDSLHIDERFISDHHGVIMATIHHGINQAILKGLVPYDKTNIFATNYPFNYIQGELGWSSDFTLNMIGELSLVHELFIEEDVLFQKSLLEIAGKLKIYSD